MDVLYQSSRNTLQMYYTYIENHYEHSAATHNHFFRTPLLRQKLSQNKLLYFSINNEHLMYNAHPKLFRHFF
jgi:hypothetical protein